MNVVRYFLNYAIILKLCDRMRFEVDCAKSHHRVIPEGLIFSLLLPDPPPGKKENNERPPPLSAVGQSLETDAQDCFTSVVSPSNILILKSNPCCDFCWVWKFLCRVSSFQIAFTADSHTGPMLGLKSSAHISLGRIFLRLCFRSKLAFHRVELLAPCPTLPLYLDLGLAMMGLPP